MIAAAAVDRTCRVVATVGDVAALQGSRLPAALPGRRGEAMRTPWATRRMLLPQVVVFDRDVAIADSPDGRLAVSVFTRDSGSAANWTAFAAIQDPWESAPVRGDRMWDEHHRI